MSIEVECGKCQGRLLVEDPGTVVACPHCGTHLTFSDLPGSAAIVGHDAAIPNDEATESEEQPVVESAEAILESDSDADTSTSASVLDSDIGFSVLESAASAQDDAADCDTLDSSETQTTNDDEPGFGAQVVPSEGELAVGDDSIGQVPSDTLEHSLGSAENDSEILPPAIGDDACNVAEKSAATMSVTPSKGASRLLFVLVASYASAATIAAIWLFTHPLATSANPHELESLPDVKPRLTKDGMKTVFVFYPEDAELPAGHTLRLGQQQRFGNIKVTPLRVVLEPLEFVHFSGNPSRSRSPTAPVLKLWVRFENVSSDQTIAPVDRKLMLDRMLSQHKDDSFQANNFVCRRTARSSDTARTLMYDLPVSGDWDFRDCAWTQTVNDSSSSLEPGAWYETYIPSAENVDELTGHELIWRLHFRKGYSSNGYGVTTLIDVVFDASEIKRT